tara:strand:- start:3001 stop:3264 length:264 start_codon:yes stop_codon:yes gene_type:complete
MSIPARSFTMNTIQIVKNIFTQTTHSNVKLGRWGVGTHSKSGLIVDYSNEDHCGTCSQYILQKSQERSNDDQWIHEFESISCNVPNK